MENAFVVERLRAMRGVLLQAYSGGASMSTSSKGNEREAFVKHVLANVIAPPFRIGSGDITDTAGHRTGQLDTVIEFSTSISFPMLRPDAPRLYLAEGVCAVIEIKSDLQHQWSEVVRSRAKVAAITQKLGAALYFRKEHEKLRETLPYLVVGFHGWKTLDTVREKVKEGNLDGLLLIEEGLFAWPGGEATGDYALFAFFAELHRLMSRMLFALPNYQEYLNFEVVPPPIHPKKSA